MRLSDCNVSVRKSYEISELSLSEGSVRGLVTGALWHETSLSIWLQLLCLI